MSDNVQKTATEVRSAALQLAHFQRVEGESAEATIARAKLFADFILQGA